MPFITHQLRRSESMVPTRHMTGRCATAGSSNDGDATMQRCLVGFYSLSNARIGSRRREVMDPAKARSHFRLPNAARAHFRDFNHLTCDTRLPHPAGKLERPVMCSTVNRCSFPMALRRASRCSPPPTKSQSRKEQMSVAVTAARRRSNSNAKSRCHARHPTHPCHPSALGNRSEAAPLGYHSHRR